MVRASAAIAVTVQFWLPWGSKNISGRRVGVQITGVVRASPPSEVGQFPCSSLDSRGRSDRLPRWQPAISGPCAFWHLARVQSLINISGSRQGKLKRRTVNGSRWMGESLAGRGHYGFIEDRQLNP